MGYGDGMATVTASVEVSAAPQRVWEVLVDPSRYGEWLDLHHGFAGEAPAAFTRGTSFAQKVKVLGMPSDVRWTVESVEPPNAITLEGTGPMGIGLRADYGVEATDVEQDACRVTVAMDFSGPAVMMVAGQLEREVGDQLRSSLAKLAALSTRG